MTSPTAAAPLYITIGPPCAGKTTWIRNQQQQQQQQHQMDGADEKDKHKKNSVIIHDVCIDDQAGVYVPVSTSWFLGGKTHHDSQAQKRSATAQARNLMLHGKSALDRIQKDQVELCTILARLSNHISREACEQKLGNHTEASRGILAAVENYIEQSLSLSSSNSHDKAIQLPETIDLFVVEALFRPDSSNNTRPPAASGAIERAGQALRHHAISDAIVWGNTNCRSTDYQDALQLAVRQERPVYFVVYSETDDQDDDVATTRDGPRRLLYARNLQELFQRSIDRLVKTGRYVPSNVICDMRRRCLEMTTVSTTMSQMNQRHGATSGMELECYLAQLAQYELDPVTRLVRALPAKRRLDQQQQQQQQPNNRYNDVHLRARAGRFQPPQRGGMMHGGIMNQQQYGNYHSAASSNNPSPRGRGGGRWGGRTQGKHDDSRNTNDRGANGAWR